MNEPTQNSSVQDRKQKNLERVRAGLRRRYGQERRFKLIGLFSVFLGLSFLLFFFAQIISDGYTAFVQSEVQLTIDFDASTIDPTGQRNDAVLAKANYRKIVSQSLINELGNVTGRTQRKELLNLVSGSASYLLRDKVNADHALIGTQQKVWLLADDEVDMYLKSGQDPNTYTGRLSARQIQWIETLKQKGVIKKKLNKGFLSNGDSREPEVAGIMGAALGSFYMLLVTIVIAFPVGVATAIYLEEFAPTNRWTDLIEVNINNLAAVPSIVFGLLGLAVFINFFQLPRSAPLVGGLVLSLMTLPVVIIAGRASIKSVPPSIREAALGLGASHNQMVMHHVLPLALPGMLTGAIIGMARALGESAPLLMIGMVAFIVDKPGSPLEPATALPVQIFLWFDIPERAFIERTYGAIIVLLIFLLTMNASAVWLRKKFERRW